MKHSVYILPAWFACTALGCASAVDPNPDALAGSMTASAASSGVSTSSSSSTPAGSFAPSSTASIAASGTPSAAPSTVSGSASVSASSTAISSPSNATSATGALPTASAVLGEPSSSASNAPTAPASSSAQSDSGEPDHMADAGVPSEPGDCDESEAPENVSAWIEESWNGQLGDNVTNRQAWLLDSVMMGEGNINLCVRWGATTAPSDTVKATLASSVESWFNDWFNALGDYGCFPYGSGIHAKITGWAVRPGNEDWVSDLGSEVAVYTETDPDGEPKCPDACSFFEHWDHAFPNCAGGEDFHTDYWLWVDDTLPGGGGAAAVGGDWGLRMPVDSLINSLGKSGSPIIEHEMGHGFGFQDYYDWTGSTPAGGSLMIVGSQNGGTPSVGDTWLLKRTWLESARLRGW